jgi:[protein-PII] uridylyltransferase
MLSSHASIMSQLDFTPADAKEYLASGDRRLKEEHEKGLSGIDVCSRITDLRDAVVEKLLRAALADLGEDGPDDLLGRIALVAHGGYGRRDLAPFSDIDLMVLYEDAVAERAERLATRLFRDVFDSGLMLGHSVRTPGEACRLAAGDAATCTSLMESRFLLGDTELTRQFREQFRSQFESNPRPMLNRIVESRRNERHRFGDTVFLLQPNLKQSLGGLRDVQLLRWVGFLWHGAGAPEELARQGVLSQEDFCVVQSAYEFLLRLRNELHFHAGRGVDVLDRADQARIAALRGYPTDQPLLPVELFMRDCFRHTGGITHVVNRTVAKAQSRDRIARLATAVFGHRVEGGVRVGISGMFLTREGLRSLRGNLVEMMRVVALSSLYDKPIAPATWESIRHEARRLPDEVPPEACRRFVSLLSRTTRLGALLRDLHDVGILGRFVPEFEHARGLLQFNQYHKYTVDEHCLRAVEFAAGLKDDSGPFGNAYRNIKQKHVLHLALLIHDLGKGFEGNHCEVGERIAEATASRLELSARETETLTVLVREHDLMNHLVFRRDTSDERLVTRFVAEVGSPERLRMLYVMTASDLAAVGPRVWDGWKSEVLTNLYNRAVACLSTNVRSSRGGPVTPEFLDAVAESMGRSADRDLLRRELRRLPEDYVAATGPAQVAEDLQLLEQVDAGNTVVSARYLAETETVQFTIGAVERPDIGIFHRLTFALSGKGLQIRSAEIHTLTDGVVLDRFCVHDPDYAGEPPGERIEQVNAALIASLAGEEPKRPGFRPVWRTDPITPLELEHLKTQVQVDNATSEQYTIFDVFGPDRPGLLHAVAQAIYEMDLSVARARVGTYGNQVVDVFYVTDRQGAKLADELRIASIQRRLRKVVEQQATG